MATAEANLKDFITCAVCLEEFKGRDPRSLPCLHAFCLSCIQHIHQTATDSKTNELRHDEFRCPTCQKISPIPNNSILDFQHFYHANALHDIYQDINKSTTASKKQWSLCWNDHRDVERYCFTCTKSFCHQCFLPHTKTRRYADHVHVQVTKDNIQCLVCTEHDQFVEAYCTDCGKSVCSQCLLTTHTDHDVQDFMISKFSDQDLVKEIKERLSSNQANYDRIDGMQNDFNANINAVKDNISKHTKILIDNIHQQSKQLLAELDRHQRNTNREMEKMKACVRESETLITKVEQQIKQKMQPIPELPDVRPKHSGKSTAVLKEKLPKKFTLNEKSMRYEFIPETSQVVIGILSELNQSQQSDSFNDGTQPDIEYNQSSAQSSGHVTAQDESNALSGIVEPASVKLVQKIPLRGMISDIAWTNTGDSVVLINGMITMYDRYGRERCVRSDAPIVKGKITAMAAHPTQSTIAVATEKRNNAKICMISLESRQSATRVCILRGICSCMTYTSDGALLISVNNRIYKYQTDGTKLWERKTKHRAMYITFLPSKKYIISGDEQMSLCDEDGEWISSFPSDPQTLSSPRGVCADSKGHVYVADHTKRVLLMFTSDGKYICKMLGFDMDPERLALSHDRHMCVSLEAGFIARWSRLYIYLLN